MLKTKTNLILELIFIQLYIYLLPLIRSVVFLNKRLFIFVKHFDNPLKSKMKKISVILFFCIGFIIALNAQSNTQLILDGTWKGMPVFDGTSKQGKAKIESEVLTGVVELPDNQDYKEVDFDDSNWQVIDDLSRYDYSYTDGAIGFNRYFWLRKNFVVSESLNAMLNKTGSISLYFKGISAPNC